MVLNSLWTFLSIGEEIILVLQAYGWNQSWEELRSDLGLTDRVIGRVILEHKRLYRVITEQGEVLASVSGRMNYEVTERSHFPCVGDWVVMTVTEDGKGLIHNILPRKSSFSRKSVGRIPEEQIVATNIDTVFLVLALNQDFNIRRLERYLVMVWESGANPVILLNKADLCEDLTVKQKEVELISLGVPIHIVSVETGMGLDLLQNYIHVGKTIALLGSSGVGKSSLVNRWLGKNKQITQTIRSGDDRGRHTTTYRELILLPQGGCMIDTPGMRELQLWEAPSGLNEAFADIEALGNLCKFTDCQHQKEQGCAVQQALREGKLDQERYQHFLKLQRELAFLARKKNKRIQSANKQKMKQIKKQQRKYYK